MKMIRTLPTDRNGNVYYGPKTVKEAESAISMDAEPNAVVALMRKAGYVRAASIVANRHSVSH